MKILALWFSLSFALIFSRDVIAVEQVRVFVRDTARVPWTPTNSYFHDQEIRVLIEGLKPNERVTLRVDLSEFTSWGTFWADAKGQVDNWSQAPFSGTYFSIDPDGFFWSMLRRNAVKSDPTKLIFTVLRGSTPIAATTVVRFYVDPKVGVQKIREDGLYADLHRPSSISDWRNPVVIVLGGMEGGIVEASKIAAYFAARGYPALAMAYFRADSLPGTLARIPVESVSRAMDWLSKQPGLRKEYVLYGKSRGGELALAAASKDARVKGVIAIGASPLSLCAGKDSTGRDIPSLTFNGEPIPFLPCSDSRPRIEIDASGRSIVHNVTAIQQDLAKFDSMTLNSLLIPIEKIAGPVLFLSGAEDQVWPACALNQIAFDRMQKLNPHRGNSYLCYAMTGHLIGLAGLATTESSIMVNASLNQYWSVGGDARGMGRAARDARLRILYFLQGLSR